jgi:hypothetical protein
MNEDFKRQLALPNWMRSHVGRREQVFQGLHQLMPTLVKNTTGSNVPPYSMLEVQDSATTNSLDQAHIGASIRLDAGLVTETSTELYISSGPLSIAAGKSGMGYVGSVLPFAVSANIGDFLTPSVGALTPSVGTSGPLIVYAKDAATGLVLSKHAGGGSAGSAHWVLFEFVSANGYYAEDAPDIDGGYCEYQPGYNPTGLIGKVVRYPCGFTAVPKQDANGNIPLVDPIGWTDNRSADELIGKRGFAFYMSEAGYAGSEDSTYGDECEWCIDIPNLFRERRVQTDTSKEEDLIRFKFERMAVWDHCLLEDYTIPLKNCPDPDYYDCY